MDGDWSKMHLDIAPYRETGTGVLRGVDDILALLDEQVLVLHHHSYVEFFMPSLC